MPDSYRPRGRSGGAITTKSQRFTPGDLLGSSRVWLVGRRTRGRRLMAQQKSEDRVVPEGGVMPVERAGSSPGGQGKAVPVEETAVQLSLTIVTAENPRGATRRRSRDRLGEIRAGAPKAIGKTGTAASATMEEVAYRLTDALLKVASNKGAPGPDGQTIEVLCEQWPVVLPRLHADLLEGMYRPGEIRRAYIPKAGGGGWGFLTWSTGWFRRPCGRCSSRCGSRRSIPRTTGSDPAEVATRRSPRPRRISRTATSGW